MSLPKARSDSNAPRPNAENGPSTGDLATVGFTKVDYESFRPAKRDSEVASTESDNWSMGQDGTSIDAYSVQPDELGGKGAPSLSVASKGQQK